MSITPEELAEKRHFIQPGMEFIVPSRHVQSGHLLVRVTSVSTINKTSCWGEYQKEIVHFEEVCQASKRKFVNKQRLDGSTYTDIEWVLVDKYNTNNRCMSLAGFIEYQYNKRQILEA